MKTVKTRKQWIAGLLIVTLLLPIFFIETAYANPQRPIQSIQVDRVHFIGTQDPITNQFIIKPTITVNWQNPEEWASSIGNINDPNDVLHKPRGYDLILQNRTKGTRQSKSLTGKSVEAGALQTMEIHQLDGVQLETGTLYEMRVKPYHYHERILENGDRVLGPKITSSDHEDPKAFVATDIHMTLKPAQDEIVVEWDDIEGQTTLDQPVTYRILYTMGDFANQSKEQMERNKSGEVKVTKNTPGVEPFYDSQRRRNRLRYTFDKNIIPGRMYSFMIDPLIPNIEGKTVMRNFNDPHIFTTVTQLYLTAREDGNYVRLEWNIPPEMTLGGEQEKYELTETRLVEHRGGVEKNIALFPGRQGAVLGYYRYRKPDDFTEYQIKLTYTKIDDKTQTIQAESVKVPFIPTALMIQPTKPYIPKPIPKDWEVLQPTEKTQYLLPEDKDQINRERKHLVEEGRVFYVNPRNYGINFVWSAFRHKDYDPKSSTYQQEITDFDTYYDIWITDDYQALSSVLPLKKDVKVFPNEREKQIINSQEQTIGYHVMLDQYYQQQTSSIKSIIPNQVYYIKIVAKKKWGSKELFSEPEIMSIYIDYNGDVFVPPILSKPPLKEKETKQRESTITWRETWWEVIQKEGNPQESELNQWTSRVWLKDGKLYSEKQANAEEFELITEKDVELLKRKIENFDQVYSFREVRMGKDSEGRSDVQYEFLSIPYEQVEEELQRREEQKGENYTLEDYIKDFVQAEKEEDFPYQWETITPTQEPKDKAQLLYTKSGLEPNKSYLFLLRGYRKDLDGKTLRAFYPTAVVITTLLEETPIHPDPVVPYLRLHEARDIDITVKWKYNTAFTYEVYYGEVEDIQKAKPFPIVLPENPRDPNYPQNDKDFLLQIPNLFPNTQYYFWIRATQGDTGKQSAWSNPLLVTTKDVIKPQPPRGLGVASKENLKIKGYTEPVGENYITVEWLRDWDDRRLEEEQTEGPVKKAYSYIVEVSDTPSFTDVYTVETTDENTGSTINPFEILMKNVVKLNDLVGNRLYYVRVKTKVTVVGSGDQQIQKESDYSAVIKIFTSRTGSEYDGEMDPTKVPLPDQDYELIYDAKTQRLTYRIRGFEIGQDKHKDNRVDQRFISRMIRTGIYTFPVDMKEYKKFVKERVVQVPYTVVQTFADRKMGIQLYTDSLAIRIPYEVFNQVLKEAGPDANMEIRVYNWLTTAKNPGYDRYLSRSKVQEVTITGQGSKGKTTISYAAAPMPVTIPYEHERIHKDDAPLYHIQIQDSTGIWKEHKGKHQPEKGQYEFQTQVVGTYGLFLPRRQIPVTQSDPSDLAMTYITMQYGIQQIQETGYNPSREVTQGQMLQLLYNIVYHTKNPSLVKPLTTTQQQQLQKSQLWVYGKNQTDILRREEAISLLVRLYELQSGTMVGIPRTQPNTIMDYDQVQLPYGNHVLKAKDLGLIDNRVRPKDSIQWRELFPMLYDVLVMTGEL